MLKRARNSLYVPQLIAAETLPRWRGSPNTAFCSNDALSSMLNSNGCSGYVENGSPPVSKGVGTKPISNSLSLDINGPAATAVGMQLNPMLPSVRFVQKWNVVSFD